MNALILVDLQNDFCPGGALPVADGDSIIPLINTLQSKFELIVATQDWHPPDHGSFAANHAGKKPGDEIELNGLPQILWPTHCVQHSHGAELVAALDQSRITKIFQKGTDPAIDSYSGFFDNGHRKSTGLGEWLTDRRVRSVSICGLATDYCVKFTALDARRLGLETSFLQDACRGVNLKAGDVESAIEEMRRASVRIVDGVV
jgi:nicotinamidase/pyrazinamidase